NVEWHYLDRLCRAEVLTLKEQKFQTDSMALSPDGKYLASASSWYYEADKKPRAEVKGWDGETGQELLTLKGLTTAIRTWAFSPDGKHLASANGEVTVWDVQTGRKLLSLKGGGWDVVFSPDGKSLASAAGLRGRSGILGAKAVKVWDAQT